MSALRGAAVALTALMLLGGCSIKKMAIKTVADSMAESSANYTSDEDPELIREALPFGLKTLEGLAETLPNHRPLLRSLASGFTSYAVGFLVPEIRPLEETDLERSRELRVRSRLMLLRARDYALRSLEVEYPGFRAALFADAKTAVERVKVADVPDLYWAAAAWGSAVSQGKDQMDLVAEVPIVEALIRRALALDESWEQGSLHEFMIVFESRGEASGGSYQRARQHFDRAMALSNGRKIGPLVSLAENVSVYTGNRKEFDELLARALEFDVNSAPESRLINILGQRRARQLQAMADELFPEDL
ncbi:MAG TPA: TRAP transporter TatT component family protein [Vicinamibacterales bacterium]|nr:TRAP transporter TatT component family protein [Acidobacteriota bacterium]HOC19512.1 TRAP transporter TatT component family protein [Vicinamibacterales bacterium]